MLEQLPYGSCNIVGKTIKFAVLDSDEVRLVFTDGTFVNAVLHNDDGGSWDYGRIENSNIMLKSNLAGGTTNPYEARQLFNCGIITQSEHDTFCAEYEQQSVRGRERALERERQEYLRLREKFNP